MTTMRKPRVVASCGTWWVRAYWPNRQQQPTWAPYPTWREAIDAALSIGYRPSEDT